MKQKLFVLMILLSLLVVSSGTASAQGTTSPFILDDSAAFSKRKFVSRNEDGKSTVAIAPAAESAELVTVPTLVNPNFEQGPFVGWTESSTQGWPLVLHSSSMPFTPKSGSWAAWLGGDDNETSILSQGNLTIINPTHLRLWYWIDSFDECGWDFGYIRINGMAIHTWNLCEATDTGGWMPFDLDLSAYSGQTVTLSIVADTDPEVDTFSSLFIDDISLYGTFADVPFGYWSWNYIEGLYTAGVTSGCSITPSLFCPLTTVTRDQMAVFLLKGKYGSSYTPPPPSGVFGDVPMSYWAGAWIEQLSAEGITSGCGNGNYCPTSPVTRDQMAVFLLKAKHGSSYSPPPASGVFQDVPTNHWAAAWIEQLAAEEITAGCGSGNYCPGTPVTRDQMAVFLVRTFGLATP